MQAVDELSLENQSKVTDGDVVGVRKPSSSEEEWRKKKLLEELQLDNKPTLEVSQLREFLMQNHMVFSLKEGEHGETDIATMSIDTGDAHPCRQVVESSCHNLVNWICSYPFTAIMKAIIGASVSKPYLSNSMCPLSVDLYIYISTSVILVPQVAPRYAQT